MCGISIKVLKERVYRAIASKQKGQVLGTAAESGGKGTVCCPGSTSRSREEDASGVESVYTGYIDKGGTDTAWDRHRVCKGSVWSFGLVGHSPKSSCMCRKPGLLGFTRLASLLETGRNSHLEVHGQCQHILRNVSSLVGLALLLSPDLPPLVSTFSSPACCSLRTSLESLLDSVT